MNLKDCYLTFSRHKKIAYCGERTKLPFLCAEPIMKKTFNLVQDSGTKDNLTKYRSYLFHWNQHLVHASMDKFKYIVRSGYFPKGIVNYITLLCSFYIQAKKCKKLISTSTVGSFIKSGDLKPGVKASCDQ